jgi:hypothetical protein
MEDFEKLGAFYLGRPYDLGNRKPKDGLLLYDSKDLLTHAVCLGMTGSGKTGLCLSLLEEAAIDGIPSIIIDPKGDLANLLLTFPNLKPEDFVPWVNEEDAQKKNLSITEFAAQQAETWKNGLAEWGQGGDRIQRLRDAADFRIYTPGSNAGIPVSILKSFAAPPEAIIEDSELLSERVNTTTQNPVDLDYKGLSNTGTWFIGRLTLGVQFLDDTDRAVSMIRETPERWGIIEGDVRSYLLPRFPFAIYSSSFRPHSYPRVQASQPPPWLLAVSSLRVNRWLR